MRILRTLAAIAPALLMVSCDGDFGWVDSQRYKEDFHYSLKAKQGGKLELETFNGSVEIAGSATDGVEVDGTKHANTENALKDLKIEAEETPDGVRIRVVPPYGSHSGLGARFRLRVPRQFELTRVTTSNGSMRVEDITGPAVLKSSNGSLRIARFTGNMDARTSNASIEADMTGDAMLHTSNGSIRADVTKGALDAGTSNSSVTIRLIDPPDRPVRVESSNGRIDLQMNAVRPVRATTSNSSIAVRLPANANAQLRARTSNSSIETDQELTVKGSISKNNVEGTLGSGGPLIDISTSNGSIRLYRN